MKPADLTPLDLSVLKYYKEGGQLSGFEGVGVYNHLCDIDYLDGDLELTSRAHIFIEHFKEWNKVVPYKNKIVVKVP